MLKTMRAWENKFLRRVFHRKWGSNLQTYHGESAKYFDSLRMKMNRQSTIHLALNAYFKDIYKGQLITDSQGKKLLAILREHKSRRWWGLVKKENPRGRKKNGRVKTSEGRATREYEDLAIEIIGHDWREQVNDSIDINHWMRICAKHITKYLRDHNLPQNPKYRPNNKHKNKHKEQKENKEQNKNDEQDKTDEQNRNK